LFSEQKEGTKFKHISPEHNSRYESMQGFEIIHSFSFPSHTMHIFLIGNKYPFSLPRREKELLPKVVNFITDEI